MPTPFAAELAGTHELGKLGWLLGGQIVALAIGACCVLAARNVVGFPDRLVPPSWQARAFSLALSMLVVLAGSLVTLGLPFLAGSVVAGGEFGELYAGRGDLGPVAATTQTEPEYTGRRHNATAGMVKA